MRGISRHQERAKESRYINGNDAVSRGPQRASIEIKNKT